MADTLTGITEIDAASLADISGVMQLYLQQESILVPTVTDYSQFAVKGAKSVAIPRAGGFTVGSKTENTPVDAQTSAVSSDTISFDQHRVIQFLVEEIAENQAKIALVEEYLMRAAKDLARDVDQAVIGQLALASAAAPDHQLVFIDTVTDVIARGDILAARKLLQDQFINPKECFILVGPEKENELLNISDFIDASKYGSREAIYNGEIGRVYGMPVLVHVDATDRMFTYHKTAVGLAFQRAITVQSQPDLSNLAERWSLDMRYGVEVLDSGKRVVFTDSTN